MSNWTGTTQPPLDARKGAEAILERDAEKRAGPGGPDTSSGGEPLPELINNVRAVEP